MERICVWEGVVVMDYEILEDMFGLNSKLNEKVDKIAEILRLLIESNKKMKEQLEKEIRELKECDKVEIGREELLKRIDYVLSGMGDCLMWATNKEYSDGDCLAEVEEDLKSLIIYLDNFKKEIEKW